MGTTVYKFNCAWNQLSSDNMRGMFSPRTVIKLTLVISHEDNSAVQTWSNWMKIVMMHTWFNAVLKIAMIK